MNDEKNYTTSVAEEISDQASEPSREDSRAYDVNVWKPGFMRRIPWSAWASLVGASLGVAASIALVIKSNNTPIDDWAVQPSVWLSIAISLTGACLRSGLQKGSAISWWTRALSPDSTVSSLHYNWEFSSSLWAVLTAGRRFNMVALAALAVHLLPMSGPLIQRAVRVRDLSSNSTVDLSLRVARDWPDDFATGYTTSRSLIPTLLTSEFTPIVMNHYLYNDIELDAPGCDGICTTAVEGIGFSASCSSYDAPYDLNPVIGANGQPDMTAPIYAGGLPVFQTRVEWAPADPGALVISSEYKPTEACVGALRVTNCTLRLATVKYPVVVEGNSSTVTLAPGTSILTDAVVNASVVPKFAEGAWSGPSSLAGVYLALNNYFASSATIMWDGAVNYRVDTQGVLANSYAVLTESAYQNCTLSFQDPMPEVLESARTLMFRSAVAKDVAKASDAQQVTAEQELYQSVYRSSLNYLGGGLVALLLAFVCILPLFSRWWILGRDVSMSPVEVASALGSDLPGLEATNQAAKSIVRKSGNVRARYGVTRDRLGRNVMRVAVSASGVDAPTALETFGRMVTGE